MEPQDLQDNDTPEQDSETTQSDSPPANNTSSSGQSQNSGEWENRFKGLQRKFNQLQTKLEAKDSRIQELMSQIKELQSDKTEVAKEYEGQLSETKSEAETLREQLEAATNDLKKYELEVKKHEQRDVIRKKLSTPDSEFDDLLPWFEDDLLRPFGDDGEPLEDEDLDNYLRGFQQRLQGKSKEDFDKRMNGSTPPSLGTSSAAYANMSEDDLAALVAQTDPTDDNFAQIEDAYLKAVEKRVGKQPFGDVFVDV